MATAALLPMPRAVFYNSNGAPLAGGFVNTYIASTTTPKTSWQDAAETTPNANPIVLDSNGSCLLYGSGAYSLAVTDALGAAVPAYSGLTVDSVSQIPAIPTVSPAMAPVVAAATLVSGMAMLGESWAITPQFFDAAAGTPLHDCTAAIQSAINAAQNGAGCVYLPAGTYVVSTPLTMSETTAGTKFYGAGARVSVIQPTSTTANVFNITSANGLTPIEMCGFSVEYTFTNSTAGTIFNLAAGCGGLNFHDVVTINGWNVMTLGGGTLAQSFIVEKCVFQSFLNNGITVDIWPGGLGFFSQIFMNCSASNLAGIGLNVISGQSLTFEMMQVQGMFAPILFQTKITTIITDITATNVYADNAARGGGGSGGWTIDGHVAPCRRFQLTNCWGGANGGAGFVLNATDEVSLVNCVAIANMLDGISLLAGCSNTIIQGCQAVFNSQAAANVSSGISVSAVCVSLTILGNACGPSVDFPAATQRYGIIIGAGATDEYIISYNRLAGNATGGLLDNGAGLNKIVGNNLT